MHEEGEKPAIRQRPAPFFSFFPQRGGRGEIASVRYLLRRWCCWRRSPGFVHRYRGRAREAEEVAAPAAVFSGATDLQVFLGGVELEVAIGTDRGNKVGARGLGAGDLFSQQLMGKVVVQACQSRSAALELAAPVEACDAGGLDQFLGNSRDEGVVEPGDFPRSEDMAALNDRDVEIVEDIDQPALNFFRADILVQDGEIVFDLGGSGIFQAPLCRGWRLIRPSAGHSDA